MTALALLLLLGPPLAGHLAGWRASAVAALAGLAFWGLGLASGALPALGAPGSPDGDGGVYTVTPQEMLFVAGLPALFFAVLLWLGERFGRRLDRRTALTGIWMGQVAFAGMFLLPALLVSGTAVDGAGVRAWSRISPILDWVWLGGALLVLWAVIRSAVRRTARRP